MTTRTRWAAAPALVAVSALALGGAVVVAPAVHAVAPATCGTGSDYTVGDVDHDGVADSVVGLPTASGSAGAVDLNLTSAPDSLVTRASVTGLGASTAGDRFGAAAALADADRDGCDDVVVGAPGEGGKGAVHVVFGATTGFRATGGVTITAPRGAAGDRFGTAIAVVNGHAPGGQVADTWSLWVGAPGRTVNGAKNAGALYHYRLTHAGSAVTATLIGTVSQATGGVPGSSRKDDGFGSVLAASDSQVVVGIPQKDVGGKRDAGAIVRLVPSTDLPLKSALLFSQSSRGVPGTVARGDRFGAAVTALYKYFAVGTPGDDIAGHKNAGSVQVFRAFSASKVKPVARITQGGRLVGRAVPGADEAGDHFGASVAYGMGFLCVEELDLAVGAPGENVGRKVDAGTVTVVAVVGDGRGCKPKGLTQGKGLAGTAEKGDRVGSAVAAVVGRTDFDRSRQDQLFVGAPGEKVGAVAGAGVVNGWHGTALPSVGRIGGPLKDARFGSVLAVAATGAIA